MKKKRLLSIFNSRMYVSSCQTVDVRIDIVKYEEGFFIVVKVIKKGVYIINVSVKVRSKTKFQFDFKPPENMEKKESKLTKIKLNGLTNKSLQTFSVEHFWKILWI